jgi:hypothetical protein
LSTWALRSGAFLCSGHAPELLRAVYRNPLPRYRNEAAGFFFRANEQPSDEYYEPERRPEKLKNSFG